MNKQTNSILIFKNEDELQTIFKIMGLHVEDTRYDIDINSNLIMTSNEEIDLLDDESEIITMKMFITDDDLVTDKQNNQMYSESIKELESFMETINSQIEQVLHCEDENSKSILYLSTLEEMLMVTSVYKNYLEGGSEL